MTQVEEPPYIVPPLPAVQAASGSVCAFALRILLKSKGRLISMSAINPMVLTALPTLFASSLATTKVPVRLLNTTL